MRPDSSVARLVDLLYLSIYGVVKYLPTPIGDPFRSIVLRAFAPGIRTWWVHEGVTIRNPRGVRVGAGTSLNECVFINGYGGVTIGRDVAIGAHCMFASFEHAFKGSHEPMNRLPVIERPIIVEDDVYFGYGVVVLGGLTIGRGAVVGAGSVVTQDIPPFSVACGVPARVVSTREATSPPPDKT